VVKNKGEAMRAIKMKICNMMQLRGDFAEVSELSSSNRVGIAGRTLLCKNSVKRVIAVIGTGYVGLVTGAGLAEFGNDVICADINQLKMTALQRGEIPIYEPGLEQLVMRTVGLGKLSFTSDVEQAIRNADVIFIAVGTPMGQDGAADMTEVESVIQSIAKNHCKYQVIVTKSTVPIGTGKRLKQLLLSNGLHADDFDIVSNPEFLREGSAVLDFLEPDRIIIGADSTDVIAIMCSIYETLISNKIPCVFTDVVSAEMTKYAANAFLATKLSFINEIANLCDKVGANVRTVAYAMGLDHRISPRFFNPGPGFGGYCFPKDTQALLWSAKNNHVALHTIQAALLTNASQQLIAVKKLQHLLKKQHGSDSLHNKTVAVLGLAFKANTDDIRCSPACAVVQELLSLGATVKCYDPAAMIHAKREIPLAIYCVDPYETVKGADAILVMTEWDEFKQLDWDYVAESVTSKVIVDARNILNPLQLKSLGFMCDAIGLSCLYRNETGKSKTIVPLYQMIEI
jgi:UDPglucose 6-dehydrogenase